MGMRGVEMVVILVVGNGAVITMVFVIVIMTVILVVM